MYGRIDTLEKTIRSHGGRCEIATLYPSKTGKKASCRALRPGHFRYQSKSFSLDLTDEEFVCQVVEWVTGHD